MRSTSIQVDDRPSQVTVRRLRFRDWDDQAEAGREERERILAKGLSGWWYVNPIWSVHSPDPSEEFFEEVGRRQGDWCRMLSRHFNKGWRTLRRQSRSAYSRGEDFEGILIIEGVLGLPEDIPEIRRRLGQRPTVTYRKQVFGLLKQREIQALKVLTDDELERCLISDRFAAGYAYFVLPHATVESPTVTNAFIGEARRRNREWHRSVDRLFPKRERRQFVHENSDIRILMPKGTLVVAGELQQFQL